MEYQTVKAEHRGPVLRIRMNRPGKLNAQNPNLIEEMDAAFASAAADADVRVVVLSGEGRAFSAGHDLEYPGYDRRGYTYHSRLDMERRDVGSKRSEEFDQWWRMAEEDGGGFKPGGLRQTFRRRADKQ
jgi:enoyl-CoA hydratase/carnithine racemase